MLHTPLLIHLTEALKQLLILERTPEPDTPPLSPVPESEQRTRNGHDQNALEDKVKRERDRNGSEKTGPSKRIRKEIVIVEENEIEVVDLTNED